MNKACPLFLLLSLAACNQAPAPEPATPGTALSSAGAEPSTMPEVIRPKPERAPVDLKAPLPEGFQLPFAYHRLYDNTGKTDSGSPQRRVMVEFIGTDLPGARAALTRALADKGFGVPEVDQVDGLERLAYTRSDGASVVAKFDDQPKALRMREQGAMGTLHLTWNAP